MTRACRRWSFACSESWFARTRARAGHRSPTAGVRPTGEHLPPAGEARRWLRAERGPARPAKASRSRRGRCQQQKRGPPRMANAILRAHGRRPALRASALGRSAGFSGRSRSTARARPGAATLTRQNERVPGGRARTEWATRSDRRRVVRNDRGRQKGAARAEADSLAHPSSRFVSMRRSGPSRAPHAAWSKSRRANPLSHEDCHLHGGAVSESAHPARALQAL
jgi:hypothetical protein